MAAPPSQQFCVKWNSYSTNLQSVFPRLLTSEHFVDVTLACEGQMIKCHKVVLSACSTYFERLLVSNPCPHPIIFMKDMKHFEVQALVDFMYRGEVNVSQDELNSLLVAAEALQIRGLCGSDNAVNGGGGGTRLRGAGPTTSSPPLTPTRESPPPRHHHGSASKRRRSDGDDARLLAPRIVSVSSNGEEVVSNLGPTAADGPRRQHAIKQESIDCDESYRHEPDGDILDQDLDRLEQQEDSDGLREESESRLGGQAGPSGLSQPASRSGTDTPDKTATDWDADPLAFEPTPILRRYPPPPPPNSQDSVLRRLLQSTSSRPDLSISATDNLVTPITFVRIKSEPSPDPTDSGSEPDSGSETVYTGSASTAASPRRRYTTPQLRRALEEVGAGVSIYSAARANGIPPKTLRNWMGRLDIKSKYALPSQLARFFRKQRADKKMRGGKK